MVKPRFKGKRNRFCLLRVARWHCKRACGSGGTVAAIFENKTYHFNVHQRTLPVQWPQLTVSFRNPQKQSWISFWSSQLSATGNESFIQKCHLIVLTKTVLSRPIILELESAPSEAASQAQSTSIPLLWAINVHTLPLPSLTSCHTWLACDPALTRAAPGYGSMRSWPEFVTHCRCVARLPTTATTSISGSLIQQEAGRRNLNQRVIPRSTSYGQGTGSHDSDLDLLVIGTIPRGGKKWLGNASSWWGTWKLVLSEMLRMQV